MKSKANVDSWVECGLPRLIAEWVAALPGAESRFHTRAKRFVKHGRESDENTRLLEKHWRALEKNARRFTGESVQDPVLLSIFMLLPDSPGYSPYRLVTAESIDQEKKLYAECSRSVQNSQKLVGANPHNFYPECIATLEIAEDPYSTMQRLLDTGPYRQFQQLLETAGTRSDTSGVAGEFRAVEHQFRQGLEKLAKLLKMAAPESKVPTDQPASPRAAEINYTLALGDLNHRFLTKPQHAAIAHLAAVNCPGMATVTAGAVRKATVEAERRGQAEAKRREEAEAERRVDARNAY